MKIPVAARPPSVLVPLFFAVASGSCRSEPERSALARSAPEATRAVAVEDGIGSLVPGVEARRVWVSDHVAFQESAISPDGRYVTEMDESSGDLAVRDLATGLLHRLTHKGSWKDSSDYFRNASFSPDGRRIAFSWYDDATSDYEIHVLDFHVDDGGIPRGSNHRVVYPGGPQFANLVYGWISDDDVLIGIYRPGNARALAFLTLSTGQLRVLKSFEWGQEPTRVRVSPDGRFIAYDRPTAADAADSPDRDVYLLSADGSRDTRLTEGPGVDVVLDWVPEDGSLLFHRRRSGDGSVWRLAMSDGQPMGDPVLMRSNVLDPKPIGFAKGAFYYGLTVERPAYETASLDVDGRTLRKLPMRFEAPPGGRIRTFAWTPDGEHVLHEIEHPRSPGGGWFQLRKTDGELVRDWTFDLWIMFTLFRWMPDGHSVLVPARDDRERPGFVRIDLDAGETEMVLRFDRGGAFGRVAAISPDGRKLYFTRHQTVDGRMDESFADVVEHDLPTRAERPIERVRGHGALTMSPDGGWLALALGWRTGPKTIRVIPVQGGEPRTVYRGDATPSRLPRVLGWAADSRSFLFIDRQPSDDESDAGVYRVSRAGDDVERIATIPEYGGGNVSLHPDGRTIAYRTGEARGEIWALEGLADTSSTTPDERDGSR